jgi:hypothetical protein
MPGQIVLLAVELQCCDIRGQGNPIVAGRSRDPALHQRSNIDGNKSSIAADSEGL